jgi:hypothetical protein
MPRREDIPGIALRLPDLANWKEAARALKVRPFYTGAGSVPFSRLRATQILDSAQGRDRSTTSISSSNSFQAKWHPTERPPGCPERPWRRGTRCSVE